MKTALAVVAAVIFLAALCVTLEHLLYWLIGL